MQKQKLLMLIAMMLFVAGTVGIQPQEAGRPCVACPTPGAIALGPLTGTMAAGMMRG